MAPDLYDLAPLLNRARAGDRAAWNDLLGRLRPYLRLLIRRQLSGDAEASDLTQEAQLRMDRGFPQFRGEQVPPFLAWVRTIVARVLADHAGSRPPAAVPLSDLDDAGAGAPGPRLVHAEEMTRLAGALERLSADHRLVVEARLFDGLKCVEIARRHGRTSEWVRVTCKRAVERLRELLRESS
jgi:RNA polymerase sigma-70 factor, ECF subfamily